MMDDLPTARSLAPDLRVLRAPNPSPMTYLGTNTYLLGGAAGLCIIDPGPSDPRHLDALLSAIGGAPVEAIVVTHAHLDHSPLARVVAEETGAGIFAFGPAEAGRSAVMAQLAREGLAGGGEGVDFDFRPDHIVADGDVIDGPGWSLTVLHTPGHMGNHISLVSGRAVFTGDHVMGWASSLVSPPDGDLTDFMASCRRLQEFETDIFYPGHGDPVTEPAQRLDWLIRHRLSREAAILTVLAQADRQLTIAEITEMSYTDVAPALLPAAERNVLAHLVDLTQRGLVNASPKLGVSAKFSRT